MSNVVIVCFVALIYGIGCVLTIRNLRKYNEQKYKQVPKRENMKIITIWLILYCHTVFIWYGFSESIKRVPLLYDMWNTIYTPMFLLSLTCILFAAMIVVLILILSIVEALQMRSTKYKGKLLPSDIICLSISERLDMMDKAIEKKPILKKVMKGIVFLLVTFNIEIWGMVAIGTSKIIFIAIGLMLLMVNMHKNYIIFVHNENID